MNRVVYSKSGPWIEKTRQLAPSHLSPRKKEEKKRKSWFWTYFLSSQELMTIKFPKIHKNKTQSWKKKRTFICLSVINIIASSKVLFFLCLSLIPRYSSSFSVVRWLLYEIDTPFVLSLWFYLFNYGKEEYLSISLNERLLDKFC